MWLDKWKEKKYNYCMTKFLIQSGGDYMATAFTEQEVQIIKTKLKEAARQFAVTTGVRKTSVDQLALAADISKGAFYKFYHPKKHCFLNCWRICTRKSIRRLRKFCGKMPICLRQSVQPRLSLLPAAKWKKAA